MSRGRAGPQGQTYSHDFPFPGPYNKDALMPSGLAPHGSRRTGGPRDAGSMYLPQSAASNPRAVTPLLLRWLCMKPGSPPCLLTRGCLFILQTHVAVTLHLRHTGPGAPPRCLSAGSCLIELSTLDGICLVHFWVPSILHWSWSSADDGASGEKRDKPHHVLKTPRCLILLSRWLQHLS